MQEERERQKKIRSCLRLIAVKRDEMNALSSCSVSLPVDNDTWNRRGGREADVQEKKRRRDRERERERKGGGRETKREREEKGTRHAFCFAKWR